MLLEYAAYFIIDVLLSAGILWASGRIMLVNIEYRWLVVAIVVASLVSFIPHIGIALSFLVLLWFLHEYSDAELWPNIILMVLLSRVFSFFTVFAWY